MSDTICKDLDLHKIIEARKKKSRPRFSDVLEFFIEKWAPKIPEYLDSENRIVNARIYKGVHLSRDIFSKMLRGGNYHPDKFNICKIAFALHLPLSKVNYLLGLEGYTLTDADDFDLVFMTFVENENYNVWQLNEELYKVGLDKKTFCD